MRLLHLPATRYALGSSDFRNEIKRLELECLRRETEISRVQQKEDQLITELVECNREQRQKLSLGATTSARNNGIPHPSAAPLPTGNLVDPPINENNVLDATEVVQEQIIIVPEQQQQDANDHGEQLMEPQQAQTQAEQPNTRYAFTKTIQLEVF